MTTHDTGANFGTRAAGHIERAPYDLDTVDQDADRYRLTLAGQITAAENGERWQVRAAVWLITHRPYTGNEVLAWALGAVAAGALLGAYAMQQWLAYGPLA